MKKVKALLPVAVILVIVTGALGFTGKLFIPGNVWCFTSFPNPNQSCSGQASGMHLNVNTVTSGGSTANPCPIGNPYINSGSNCLLPANGTQYQNTKE